MGCKLARLPRSRCVRPRCVLCSDLPATSIANQGEVTMSIGATRDALSRIFYQRCFWLFVVLVILIGAVSFVPATDRGRLVLNGVNMFLLIATVAAVGRTTLSFAIALLLAVPAVGFQYL